eukprot:4789472-Ditylum_brightwellii.AAC.1
MALRTPVHATAVFSVTASRSRVPSTLLCLSKPIIISGRLSCSKVAVVGHFLIPGVRSPIFCASLASLTLGMLILGRGSH